MSPPVNAGNAQKKKAAFPKKGRPKSICVVLLDVDDHNGAVPRGVVRNELRKNGRIKDVAFVRYLSCDEVNSLIKEVFSVSTFKFLKSQKDNTLCVTPKQDLTGSEVFDLVAFI